MSKREELREKRRKQQVRNRTLIFVGLGLVVIIVLGVLIYPSLVPPAPIGAINPGVSLPRPNANGLTYGSTSAPIKVIEFADFQCPACKQYNDTFDSTMVQNYITPGKVEFTYMPFSFIGAESVAAAEAALCANDQGKFWPYHDILFANQGTENSGNFSDRRLAAFAQSLGLDMTKFNTCYSSHKYQQQVQDDLALGDSKSVQGTPAFLVNDKLVNASDLFKTIDDTYATLPTK